MIHKHIGNLLAVERGILVHGCNAQGVMASGIAESIRAQFPQVFQDYSLRHRSSGLCVGDVVFTKVGHETYIASAITQEFYGRNPAIRYVDYDGLERCFTLIAGRARNLNLPVHFPLIGCGLANGKWEEVARRIERAASADIEKHLWVQAEAGAE